MDILYIGQYAKGSTSKMRADILEEIINPLTFDIIDTNVPFLNTNKVFRSLGFRYKFGPLIHSINSYIADGLNKFGANKKYDVIWVDKGIFLTKDTLVNLRGRANKLVHFTPDMAFYKNKSLKFERSIDKYDFLITTKTKEIGNYLKLIPKSKLIVTSQGFSKAIHRPMNAFEEKDGSVAFIGLAEPHRFKVVQFLIDNGVKVKLAGKGWQKFAQDNRMNNLLNFYGEGLFSDEYSKFFSSASFGLGMLSKLIPELHTTRTFEIPACGTALLTEKNDETSKYFDELSAIFYDDNEDLLSKIKYYLDNDTLLKEVSSNGYNKVVTNGYDYQTIIKKIVKMILVNKKGN